MSRIMIYHDLSMTSSWWSLGWMRVLPEISSRSCVASSSAPWEPTVRHHHGSHGSRLRRPRWRRHGTKPSWPRRHARWVRQWGRPKTPVETMETLWHYQEISKASKTTITNTEQIQNKYLTNTEQIQNKYVTNTISILKYHIFRQVLFESAAPGL